MDRLGRLHAAPGPPIALSRTYNHDARLTMRFESAYKLCSAYLNSLYSHEPELKPIMRRFRKCNDFNVPTGKRIRGLSVMYSMLTFLETRPAEADYKMSAIVGWCVEWLQASFIVHDDIMDGSLKRRGKLCWYRQRDIGFDAINDGLYLQSAGYTILRHFCHSQRWFNDIHNLLHEIQMKTIHGQALDLESADANSASFAARLCMERYKTIVKYKTSYYSAVLPVRCGLYMSGITSPEAHKKATEILLLIGFLFQVQDDYLDCFGDPKVTGKVGSDIQDNKCTWFTAKVYEVKNENIKKTLEAHYGKEEAEEVEKVKQLYRDLGLKSVYATFQKELIEEIELKVIEQKLLRREPFLDLLRILTDRKR